MQLCGECFGKAMRVGRARNWKTVSSVHETAYAGLDEGRGSSGQKGFVLWGVQVGRKHSERCRGGGRRVSHGEENRIKNNDWDLA